ncbi:aminodeoxychorismate synthase component I [Sphingomonas sanxanigenens]|nr:aminodeoxychorismate synthase component I [Sphingomonas sanxanigenens]
MLLPPPPTPFVLLDDARLAGAADARLYAAPERIVVAHHRDEMRPALAALRGAIADGLDVAGFLAYEAGHALEPRLGGLRAQPEGPLLWFGLFRGWRSIPAAEVPALLPDPAGGHVAPARPLISRAAYGAAFAEVQRLIAAGDIYQANLTFQARMATAGHPLALYAGLRRRARAGHGGIVFTGERWLLSLSPELFFTLEDGRLTARPMKGTAERGVDPAADAALAADLGTDPKQRAENLMIVDLLRNDLTRVAAPGSVSVPRLFEVETYPTVHQLTSTVTARLAEGRSAVDVVEAIFPCGSITGAPKIRAMEVIDAVEAAPRGAYTGAIGRIDAAGDASFNVAIRTLCLADGCATLGLGSGIVADSDVHLEWREALAKGAFAASAERFDLIETMAFDPVGGIALLDLHLARLTASAAALAFACDAAAVRAAILRACDGLDAPATVRLKLSRSGALAVERRPMPPPPAGPVPVKLVPLPVDPADFRLRHKTSARGFYDGARVAAGAFETLFVDPQGFLTEGSFTSLFVERDGRLLTPPLARGLLPGVLRASLIAAGRAVEQDLRPDDLQDGLLVGNARRGLIRATLAV